MKIKIDFPICEECKKHFENFPKELLRKEIEEMNKLENCKPIPISNIDREKMKWGNMKVKPKAKANWEYIGKASK